MKTNLKENSGVTLITLGIIVIVLMILAGMTIYNVNEAVNSTKMNAFTAELKIMQSQVNSLNEKMRNDQKVTVNGTEYKGEEIKNIGQEISGSLQAKADEAFQAVGVSGENKQKYRYYDENIVKNGLNVEGVKQELLINVEDREVISYNGLTYKGAKYYNLASLPEGIYNVAHEDVQAQPTFEVASKQTSTDGEWQFEVSKIQYEGYIEKWQVEYKQKGSETWNTTDDTRFTVNEAGTYVIKVTNGDVESQELECEAEYSVMPALLSGMQAISYDENGNVKEIENPNKDEWFSYEVTEDDNMEDGGTTQGGNSRWANATLNGNYYVWVPRYAYKVEEEVYKTEEGKRSNKVDTQFVGTAITNENVEEKIGEGYAVPEAFTIDDQEVSGIWVSKYEVSGTTEEPKILPNEESLTGVNNEDMSKAAQNLDTDRVIVYVTGEAQEQAIDYLTQGQYGRNGTQIPEEKEEEITLMSEEENEQEIPEELKTTTGNKYGIYNLKGEGFRLYLRIK